MAGKRAAEPNIKNVKDGGKEKGNVRSKTNDNLN